ncbi:MAG: response regulator [Cyanobacteria bacterium P01_H01_bin.15]
MFAAEHLLEFAEELVYEAINKPLSDLQRIILLKLLQGDRVTYDSLAADCGYSEKYIRGDIAPKLWSLLSEALGQKVMKSNVKALLERELRQRQETSVPAADSPSAESTESDLLVPQSVIAAAMLEAPLLNGLSVQRESILIVDDRPANLKVLSDILEKQGYDVRQATDGTIALKAIELELPDLILLDIQMPEMDGYTLCQLLKEKPQTKDIPVIFVSAIHEPWDKVRAFSVGGVDYVTKPFKLVELIARVENHLRIRKLQQDLEQKNQDLQQALEELRRLAVLDPLTQLANRDRFDSYLQKSWEASAITNAPLTLMLCGVVGFEDFTATFGSRLGDRCLQTIARLVKQAATERTGDLACRYDSTTFGIILPGVDTNGVQKIAAQLLVDFGNARINPTRGTESPMLALRIGTSVCMPAKEVGGQEDAIEACALLLQQAIQSNSKAPLFA